MASPVQASSQFSKATEGAQASFQLFRGVGNHLVQHRNVYIAGAAGIALTAGVAKRMFGYSAREQDPELRSYNSFAPYLSALRSTNYVFGIEIIRTTIGVTLTLLGSWCLFNPQDESVA